MEASCQQSLDPRIRRTRLLLQRALEDLMQTKDFDQISVQDITEAATLNRATFYDHYADKYALLECMVARRFADLLEERGVRFDAGCGSALRGIVQGVCDYLAAMPQVKGERQMQMEPHLEAAVIKVVRSMVLNGMEKHPPAPGVPAAVLASTLSWAIFGAVKEWVNTPDLCPSKVMVDYTIALLGPLLTAAYNSAAA